MDNSENSPAVLSLCAGYGGIERGLEIAGFKHRVVAYVEIEAYAIANLVAKMETGKLVPAPVWTDIKTFNAKPFRGKIDIITGGYPCQPFSSAGQRKGKDDPRHLWPHIYRIISECRPGTCFFENVEGHLTLGFSDVVRDLGRLGYYTTAGIFSAAECGAPHQRKRIFIMADANTGRKSQSKRFIEKFGGWAINGSKTKWPARPARRQFEWEEPRVLGNTTGERLERPTGPSLQGRSNGFASTSASDGSKSIKPQLGRATNGTRSRVDRLRLLGNGIVPQTAALAWRILSDKLKND